MSPIIARRLQTGVPVVHGLHIVAAAMESLRRQVPDVESPKQIKARFMKPIYLEDSAAIELLDRTGKEFRLEVRVSGVLTTQIRIVVGDVETDRLDDSQFCEPGKSFRDYVESAPVELLWTDIAGRTGELDHIASADSIRDAFPCMTKWIGAVRTAALFSISRVIGMECPGLHSVISSLRLDLLSGGLPKALSYSVANMDERLRLVNVAVKGLGIQGDVDVFVRHPPVSQPAIAEIACVVVPQEFAGQRVLIIGGSRGLGELTAKTIAAGGGYPVITYKVGCEDAERIAAEIERYGSRCEIIRYDVRRTTPQELNDKLNGPIHQLYYYATGPIFHKRTPAFEAPLFREFIEFYVEGFYRLCNGVMSGREQRLCAFYPSSIAVEEFPPGMTEYSMAKAAGEVLCSYLERSFPHLRIVTSRLPRLLTDQTATIVPLETQDSLSVLLPIIRRVQTTPETSRHLEKARESK